MDAPPSAARSWGLGGLGFLDLHLNLQPGVSEWASRDVVLFCRHIWYQCETLSAVAQTLCLGIGLGSIVTIVL